MSLDGPGTPTGAIPDAPIWVGLSGGVDSSVALMRLKQAGHDVQALFMKNWDEDDAGGECPAAQDLADARAVCDSLDVRLHTANFSSEYWERVFVDFIEDHRRGLTPNPDVLCNQEVKFRAFLEHALDRGAAYIATGHYARIRRGPRGAELLKATDPAKDQSYFLCRLDRGQLEHSLFPLGDLDKRTVRAMARDAGLVSHDKPDSTGICFIGERPFRAFLSRFIHGAPGPIVTLDGHAVGRHRGLEFYTLGQRRGLGLGGRAGDSGEPWYVCGKDLDGNRLQVVRGRDHPALWARALVANRFSWVAGDPPAREFAATGRIRHRHPDQSCRVRECTSGRFTITFDAPQWAPTPGQTVALYDGDRCLGGGIIAMPERACA